MRTKVDVACGSPTTNTFILQTALCLYVWQGWMETQIHQNKIVGRTCEPTRRRPTHERHKPKIKKNKNRILSVENMRKPKCCGIAHTLTKSFCCELSQQHHPHLAYERLQSIHYTNILTIWSMVAASLMWLWLCFDNHQLTLVSVQFRLMISALARGALCFIHSILLHGKQSGRVVT